MNMLYRSSHPIQNVATTLALPEYCRQEISSLVLSAMGDTQVWSEFISLLEREKLLVTLNWNEKPESVVALLQGLSAKFGIAWGFSVPSSIVDKLPEESLKIIGDSLEETGLVLLHIWTSEDCYRVFVLPAPAYLKIQSVSQPEKKYGGIWRWNTKMPYSV